MATQGLLFIPDISSFSRFVNQSEIDHSRLIVQELLETLINANRIGLEVSEVEGDAILFYKFGDAPELQTLYQQVERMFVDFHRSLRAYDLRKYCYCAACLAAKDLTLKVVTHYGEFTGYNVAAFSKLIGRDVIVAHELLKNDIDQHEYWLVTESLLAHAPMVGPAEWMKWETGTKKTQSGEVPFRYARLTPLKDELDPGVPATSPLVNETPSARAARIYDADIGTVCQATAMFDYRARWQPGVCSVEEVDHLLPRVGMRCRYVRDDGSSATYSSVYYRHQDEGIEFVEVEDESGTATRYALQPLSENQTRLSIETYRKGVTPGGPAQPDDESVQTQRALSASLELLNDVVRYIQEEKSATGA